MARRLAADIVAVAAHVIEHVTVADRRARDRNSQIAEIAFEAEIGHHGRDDAGPGETTVRIPALRDHRQQLVAVDDAPALVDDEHAVGVTVERDADIGAHFLYLLAKSGGLGRAAFVIDIEAVGIDPDGDDLGVELLQRLRRHPVAGAMGAIHDDAQPPERKILRQGALGELDIAVLHPVDALGAAEIRALCQLLRELGIDQLLDLVLDLVVELEAIGTEQLDAVVVEEIV